MRSRKADSFGLTWLETLHARGVRLSLEPLEGLCRALGQPQSRVPPVLVAGTNGKGSTAAMIAAAADAAGIRALLFTSPHLSCVNQRYRIGGEDVSENALSAVLRKIRDAARRSGTEPTYFEATTAAAFLLAAGAGCELQILEVGLGGRLDATNVAEPVLSVITRLGIEHTAFLGSSLEAIAREKAGIMRREVTCLAGPQEEAAITALREEASRRGAVLVRAEEGSSLSFEEGALTIRTPRDEYPGMRPALAGRFQWENALVAVRALELLAESGFGIPSDAVRAGIETVRLAGRLERRDDLLLDVAHNPQAARALASHLDDEGIRPVLLFGCLRDKDAEGILRPLLGRCREVIVTGVENERSQDAALLERLCTELAPELACRRVDETALALETARVRSRDLNAPLLVTGSLFLVGSVRALLSPDEG